jgi:hypothetical protein
MMKWRNIESMLGKRDSSMLVDKSLPPAGRAAPRPRLASESDLEQGSGGAATSTNVDIDDGNDWLDEPRQLDPEAVGGEQRMFTLGGRMDINLSSSYLRDILSNTNVAPTHIHNTASTSTKDPSFEKASLEWCRGNSKVWENPVRENTTHYTVGYTCKVVLSSYLALGCERTCYLILPAEGWPYLYVWTVCPCIYAYVI